MTGACCIPRLAFVSVVLVLAYAAHGHTLPISYLRVVPDNDYVHVELNFNPFELSSFTQMDADHDGRLNDMELERSARAVTETVVSNLHLSAGKTELIAETAGVMSSDDAHHVTLRAHYKKGGGGVISLRSDLPGILGSSHLTQVTFGDAPNQQWAKLEGSSPEVTFVYETPASTRAVVLDQPPTEVAESTLVAQLLGIGLPAALACTVVWWAKRKLRDERPETQ